MKSEDQIILSTLQQYADEVASHGYAVYAIMLKGSQNYNLSDEESDIDANLIFIPTPKQLREGKPFKLSFDQGEVTCHNIYAFADIVLKGNPQWIEVCNTKYKIGSDLSMFQHCTINPSALKGMIMEKVTAFDKLYPSREKYVKQFGYDPKQLHHIIRLYDILEANTNVLEYTGEKRNWMIQIKRGTLLTKKEAFELRDEYVQKLATIYEDRKIKYTPQSINYDILDNILINFYRDMP